MITESTKLVYFNFCVYIDLLKSDIARYLIEEISSYEDLTDEKILYYFDSEPSESLTAITLTGLDAIVNFELRMDMVDAHTRSRIKNRFI